VGRRLGSISAYELQLIDEKVRGMSVLLRDRLGACLFHQSSIP
jgi:hypothetical protein